jgi:hypothetical protein
MGPSTKQTRAWRNTQHLQELVNDVRMWLSSQSLDCSQMNQMLMFGASFNNLDSQHWKSSAVFHTQQVFHIQYFVSQQHLRHVMSAAMFSPLRRYNASALLLCRTGLAGAAQEEEEEEHVSIPVGARQSCDLLFCILLYLHCFRQLHFAVGAQIV